MLSLSFLVGVPPAQEFLHPQKVVCGRCVQTRVDSQKEKGPALSGRACKSVRHRKGKETPAVFNFSNLQHNTRRTRRPPGVRTHTCAHVHAGDEAGNEKKSAVFRGEQNPAALAHHCNRFKKKNVAYNFFFRKAYSSCWHQATHYSPFSQRLCFLRPRG